MYTIALENLFPME